MQMNIHNYIWIQYKLQENAKWQNDYDLYVYVCMYVTNGVYILLRYINAQELGQILTTEILVGLKILVFYYVSN